MTEGTPDVIGRHHVSASGASDAKAIVFSHGFGCDQRMWRFVAPAFESDHRVVLFDHVGCGRSDLSAFDPVKYASLDGYAADIAEMCDQMGLTDITFVGHSVSAMIGVLLTVARPDLVDTLVLVGPSPCYIDDGDYVGGFTLEDIDELLETVDKNFLGWSSAMAPAIIGNPDRPELGEELTNSFCRTDPKIAAHFAETTFRSDTRDALPMVTARTLVLQCSDDIIAPRSVGEYVHAAIPDSTFTLLNASGHCPNLSEPAETISAIRAFL